MGNDVKKDEREANREILETLISHCKDLISEDEAIGHALTFRNSKKLREALDRSAESRAQIKAGITMLGSLSEEKNAEIRDVLRAVEKGSAVEGLQHDGVAHCWYQENSADQRDRIIFDFSHLIAGEDDELEVAERIFDLPAPIHGKNLPDGIHLCIQEARRCYGRGYYLSVCALSRVAVEAATRFHAERHGLPPETLAWKNNIRPLERTKFWKIIRYATNHRPEGRLERHLKKIWGELSERIHSAKPVSKGYALRKLTDVCQVIEKVSDIP